MATSDLLNELNKEGFKIDVDFEIKWLAITLLFCTVGLLLENKRRGAAEIIEQRRSQTTSERVRAGKVAQRFFCYFTLSNFKGSSRFSIDSIQITEPGQCYPNGVEVEYTPWLIVGLGNPGNKYHGTRHNVGFEMIDRISQEEGILLNTVQSKALIGIGSIGEVPVLLAKPQAYMNFSGESVGPLAAYYQVPLRHILLVYDEMSLPNGVLRLQPKGGHGHHNGVKSVMNHLDGCREFPRLCIGIGNPPGTMDMKAYLLQNFSSLERKQVDAALEQGVEAVRTLLTTESFVMERGPRYNAYAELRESKLRMKNTKQQRPQQPQEHELNLSPPKKQVKFQGSFPATPTTGRRGSSVLAQSVPDFSAALRKENRKPSSMLPPMMEKSKTPPAGSKNSKLYGVGAKLGGSKSANSGEKRCGGLMARKSYATVEELKGLSSAAAHAINGENRGGRSGRGIGKTVLGCRQY
ncbi:hypothetical protein F0562_005297 [Nyssa sinensis]|uniref:Uncharacterized protein n=1 Tax=Nyssa sinensis TaxID=561372 RepID=A0A5J5AK45_9ASTE|nr:hypothetical protein F0562_005297 [Nyssa sinensis]